MSVRRRLRGGVALVFAVLLSASCVAFGTLPVVLGAWLYVATNGAPGGGTANAWSGPVVSAFGAGIGVAIGLVLDATMGNPEPDPEESLR